MPPTEKPCLEGSLLLPEFEAGEVRLCIRLPCDTPSIASGDFTGLSSKIRHPVATFLSTVTEKHHLHPPRPLHLVALTTSLRRHFSDRDLLGWSHCELGTSSNHGYDFPLLRLVVSMKKYYSQLELDSKTWSSQVGWNFWTFESTSHIFSGRPSPDIPVGRFATLRRGDSQFFIPCIAENPIPPDYIYIYKRI